MSMHKITLKFVKVVLLIPAQWVQLNSSLIPAQSNLISSEKIILINSHFLKMMITTNKLTKLWYHHIQFIFTFHVVFNRKIKWKISKLWMNKEKLTRAGFEPATSGLTRRRSTNWANEPYIGGFPILSISLFGGASQKSWNHILPFSQGSRPSYDAT